MELKKGRGIWDIYIVKLVLTRISTVKAVSLVVASFILLDDLGTDA
jgi:hypothetical protein